MATSPTPRKPNDPAKRAAFSDAYEILTSPHMRAALMERREDLCRRLASYAVDEMMPDFIENPPTQDVIEARDRTKDLLNRAIRDIDERIGGADALLKPYAKNRNGHAEEAPK